MYSISLTNNLEKELQDQFISLNSFVELKYKIKTIVI